MSHGQLTAEALASLSAGLAEWSCTPEDLGIALAQAAANSGDVGSLAMLDACTPRQRLFVESAAPRKLALKGRRAGGSYGTAIWLLLGWELWGGRGSLYVGRTLDSAKNILWDTLHELNEQFGFGAEFNGSTCVMTLPNRYWVRILGAKDERQVNHMRGFAKGARRVAIDEAGYFAGEDDLFRYMIRSVLTPQLMDSHHLGGGQLALVGNAGPLRKGFYFETSMQVDSAGQPRQNNWEVHYWTALQNTAIQAAPFLEETLGEGGHIRAPNVSPREVVDLLQRIKDEPYHARCWEDVEGMLSPEFLREYLSRWVDDPDAIIYHVRPELVDETMVLPDAIWRVTIGVDVGWDDGNAFSVVARRLDGQTIFTLESYYVARLDSSEIAEEIRTLQTRYHCLEVYVDTGGEGGKRLQDLANHGIVAEAQHKGEKKPRIEYGRSLIRQRRVRFHGPRCQDLLREMVALPWSEDKRNHREGYVDDCTDSWLAACWALTQAFVPRSAPRPKPGTPEYEAFLDEQEHERALRMGRRKRR